MSKDWKPLWTLFLLGLIGGLLFEAGDIMIRLWSRDMGLTPKDLDILNTIEILHPLKFLWAPLFSLPLFLGKWTQRRAWLLMVMTISLSAIIGLGCSPFFGAFFFVSLVVLTIARASYDALVIASQMDVVSKSHWGFSENSCVTGYRISCIAISFGALRASSWGLTWPHIYLWVGGVLALGIIFIAYSPLFRFLNTIHSSKPERLWQSVRQWMTLPGSALVFLFLLIYRLQDGLIDPQREFFLLDAGLSKIQLADLKTIASCGTIVGGFGAGACIRYKGYRTALTWGLLLHGCAGAMLYFASLYAWPTLALKAAYCIEQTTKGWSIIAIYSFQLLCCDGKSIITQLALFSALTEFGMKLVSTRSGWFVGEYGWTALMGAGSLCGLPALALLPLIFSKTFIGQKIEQNGRDRGNGGPKP
jgi:hypothetical protein